MGGRGSGNWYRWGTKDTTGEHRRIDVRQWAREGWLVPGSFVSTWQRDGKVTGSILVVVPAGANPPAEVVLIYAASSRGEPARDVRERVPLAWTPCHYGGRRPWFVCPGLGCGRRVALLYGAGVYFFCRHCYQLEYRSQREHECDRHRRRAQAIRRRLGGEPDIDRPFPPKPKGMHWRTYHRLRLEGRSEENAFEAAFWRRLAYLSGVEESDPLEVSRAVAELLE